MRRWLLVLLLLVLPFQFVWAAVAPYCGHETDAAAKKHFGHHEHRHQTDGHATPAAGDDAALSGAYHADCESCHLAGSVTLPARGLAIGAPLAMPTSTAPPLRYQSHVPSAPERPDRAPSAAAVRFGGGVAFGSHNA